MLSGCCITFTRPFGLCYEVLTPQTVEKYFLSIIDSVPAHLGQLTDEELKKGVKSEVKNEALSNIVKALKYLAYRIPNQEEKIKNLEMFRLKMILRYHAYYSSNSTVCFIIRVRCVFFLFFMQTPANLVVQRKNERAQRSQQSLVKRKLLVAAQELPGASRRGGVADR